MEKDLQKRQSQFYLVWTIVGVAVLIGMLFKGLMMAKYKKSGYPMRQMMDKNYQMREGKMMNQEGKPMMQEKEQIEYQKMGY